MRFTGLLIGFLALSLLLLPDLTAQEKKKGDKKDPDKTEKADKKDLDKDIDKPEKPEKPAKKKEEKVEHGPVIKSKIVSMRPESAHDFTIEVSMPDPQKQYNLQMWQMQQMMNISRQTTPFNYARAMASYQQQLTQRLANGDGYTMKPVDVRAAEDCKVRIMYPPVQYDDAGNLKKWTRKELDKLRAGSKLPGFPSDFDMLKTGQFVEIYLAKQHGSSKDKKWRPSQRNNKKKKDDEDPPEPMPEMRPAVVMIVIWAEPMR